MSGNRRTPTSVAPIRPILDRLLAISATKSEEEGNALSSGSASAAMRIHRIALISDSNCFFTGLLQLESANSDQRSSSDLPVACFASPE